MVQKKLGAPVSRLSISYGQFCVVQVGVVVN